MKKPASRNADSKPENIVTSLNLPGDLITLVDAQATKEQRSRSFIVVRALKRDLGLEVAGERKPA